MKTNNYFQFNLETSNRTISVPVKNLSKKQELILSKLDERDAFSYLLSFLPKHKKIDTVKTLGYIKSRYQKEDNLANRQKNHFLNVLRDQCRADNPKKPISNDFHFGIEIECYMSYESVDVSYSSGSSECSDCEGSGTMTFVNRSTGYETEAECQSCCGSGECDSDEDNNNSEDEAISEVARLIKNAGIKGCHVKGDSSIDTPDNSEYFGCEIAVLTSDFKNLEKLCKFLSDYGAKINSSCGLHVHLDARKMINDKTKLSDTALNNLNNTQDVLFSMLPKSRAKSNYCKKGYSYSDRYHAINCTAISKFNTVEIRMHSGTTDFDKIKNWCMILKTIFFHGIKSEIEFTSITEVCKFFGLSKDLKKYMLSRKNKFTGRVDETNNCENEMAA